MTTHDIHVDTFLVSIDTRGSLIKIIEKIIELEQEDQEIRDITKVIEEWTNQQIIVFSDTDLNNSMEGDIFYNSKVRLLLSVIYLKAQESMRSFGLVSNENSPFESSNLKRKIKAVEKIITSTDTEFLQKLLIETQRCISRDSKFASIIKDTSNDLQWLGTQITFQRVPEELNARRAAPIVKIISAILLLIIYRLERKDQD